MNPQGSHEEGLGIHGGQNIIEFKMPRAVVLNRGATEPWVPQKAPGMPPISEFYWYLRTCKMQLGVPSNC